MVFAIRSLILRSRIPNYSLLRRTQLHLQPSPFSTAPQARQSRAFSLTPRHCKDKNPPKSKDSLEPVVVKKAEIVQDAPDSLKSTGSAPPATPADILLQNPNPILYDEVLGEYQNPTPEIAEKIRQWQKEIDLSDEELANFLENYPGIDAPLITAIKTGKLKEDQVLKILEKQLKSEEESLSPTEKEQYAKYTDGLKSLVKTMIGENTTVSDAKLKEIGLTRDDIAFLENDDLNPEPERMKRLGAAFHKLGVTKEQINSVLALDDIFEGDPAMQELNRIFGDGIEEDEGKYLQSGDPWDAPPNLIKAWQTYYGISDPVLKYFRDKFAGITPTVIQMVVEGKLKEEQVTEYMKMNEDMLLDEGNPVAVKAFQERIGLSDEKLAYYRTKYPGITLYMISDIMKGRTKEENMPVILKQMEILSRGPRKPDGTAWPDVEAPFKSEEEMKQHMYKLFEEVGGGSIPPAQQEVFKRALEGDPMALDQLLSAMSEEQEAENERMRQPGYIGRLPQMVKQPAKSSVEVAPQGEGPISRALRNIGKPGEELDFDNLSIPEFTRMMKEEGIDPDTMEPDKVIEALEEKFSLKDYEHEWEDGSSVSYYNVESPEQLKELREKLKAESAEEDAAAKKKEKEIEAELAEEMRGSGLFMSDQEEGGDYPEDIEYRKGEDLHRYMERVYGFLDPEEQAEVAKKREKPGFFNYGEEGQDIGEDEEFQGDDISSLGHGELEQHRELREYARLAAWELPLLHKLAKPWEIPGEDQVLRFRYTTYLGEQHPASRKVVVEFCPNDIKDLSDPQRSKLIKLCGPRYNPSNEIVKMSCESFETQTQNKRYLGDLIEKLIAEAKNPNADSFADVPLDTRHHVPKPFHKFPERWKLTPERRKALEEKRRAVLEEEEKKRLGGALVDGVGVIENAMKRLGLREMLEEQQGVEVGKGGGRRGVPLQRARVPIRGRVGQGARAGAGGSGPRRF